MKDETSSPNTEQSSSQRPSTPPSHNKLKNGAILDSPISPYNNQSANDDNQFPDNHTDGNNMSPDDTSSDNDQPTNGANQFQDDPTNGNNLSSDENYQPSNTSIQNIKHGVRPLPTGRLDAATMYDLITKKKMS
jgi:hypothetical protein